MKPYWIWTLFAGLALVIVAAPLPIPGPQPTQRVFHLQAGQFAYTPSVLRVNPGDHVTIQLEATDVVHGLSIDGYPVELTADPGQSAQVSFVAGRPGVYRFRCTVTCGNMHPFMIGKIQVGPNLLYWRAAGLSLAVMALALLAGARKLRP